MTVTELQMFTIFYYNGNGLTQRARIVAKDEEEARERFRSRFGQELPVITKVEGTADPTNPGPIT